MSYDPELALVLAMMMHEVISDIVVLVSNVMIFLI